MSCFTGILLHVDVASTSQVALEFLLQVQPHAQRQVHMPSSQPKTKQTHRSTSSGRQYSPQPWEWKLCSTSRHTEFHAVTVGRDGTGSHNVRAECQSRYAIPQTQVDVLATDVHSTERQEGSVQWHDCCTRSSVKCLCFELVGSKIPAPAGVNYVFSVCCYWLLFSAGTLLAPSIIGFCKIHQKVIFGDIHIILPLSIVIQHVQLSVAYYLWLCWWIFDKHPLLLYFCFSL